MGPHPPHLTVPPPRGFHDSLDWRFLLPQEDPTKICLLFEEDADLSRALEQVGLAASRKLLLSDFNVPQRDHFSLMVMPFGISRRWAGARSTAQVEFFVSVRRFIDSGGYLLVGFNNVLHWSANSRANYYPSTPRRVASELKQAGFQSVQIFGAMPDLTIPEYIFELDTRTMWFALQNRFRRKPAVLRALRLLAGTVGHKRLSLILPCYFAIGTV